MSQLLINADDYGLHPLINEAVHRCVDKGSVNSISVMANAGFVEFAWLKRLQQSGVFVGVHLSWVRSSWLSGRHEISGWRDFTLRLFREGKKFLNELQTEGEMQINRLMENGIVPDHLDSHQHVHHLPAVWNITEKLAGQYGAKRVRCCKVHHPSLSRRGLAGAALSFLASKKFNPRSHFYTAGVKHSGNYSIDKIASELTASREVNTEFIVHPATATAALKSLFPEWQYNWKGEFDALLDLQLGEAIARNNFSLCKRHPTAPPPPSPMTQAPHH